MKRVQVAEMYKTIQGEGHFTGRAAVFVRLAGCNLWNGKQSGRSKPACAAWCDVVPLEEEKPGIAGLTSFASHAGPHGGSYTPDELRATIEQVWVDTLLEVPPRPFVVLTGGEPTLQVTPEMCEALLFFDVAVETNGTTDTHLPLTWHVCVSPKGGQEVKRRHGQELKLVYPQDERDARPAHWESLAQAGRIQFDAYYLQPMEPLPGRHHDAVWYEHQQMAAAYVQDHPFWRLSLQTHKMLGLA